MDKIELKEQTGVFKTKNGEVFGHLKLDGSNTTLKLRHDKFLHIDEEAQLYGELHDLKKVTLVKCLGNTGSYANSKNRSYLCNVFPHYVLLGDQHLDVEKNSVFELSFVIENFDSIFYDIDAFGTVIYPEELMNTIAESKERNGRKVNVGQYPIISYFSGEQQIISVETEIGTISAHHLPSHSMGSPTGVSIENKIACSINFKTAIKFNDAINEFYALLSLFELLIGQPQNILKITINTASSNEMPNITDVYISLQQSYTNRDVDPPGPRDTLLDAVDQPDNFSLVIKNWFSTNDTRRDSRYRFTFSQRKQGYDVDRLIASANMFDILPRNAFLKEEKLSNEILDAKSNCKEMFNNLPDSFEKKDLLDALSRIGRKPLKRKINERVDRFKGVLNLNLDELKFAAHKAIDCRNHYVHGGKAKLNYSQHPEITNFFTDTLEFIFAASDLIDCEWDMKYWKKRGGSHPFQYYLQNFTIMYNDLKKITSST